MKAIGLWVPDEIHDVWVKKVPREKKEVIKLAFIELLKKHADIKIDVKQEQSATIYNVVMPHIEVKPIFENKPEVRQEVRMDPEITREYVRGLKEELRRAKEVIRRKNEEIKALRQKLNLLVKLARHGDVRSIRKVLGV